MINICLNGKLPLFADGVIFVYPLYWVHLTPCQRCLRRDSRITKTDVTAARGQRPLYTPTSRNCVCNKK